MNKPIPGISKYIVDELSNYSFPGNVRELRNMVERAIIFSKGDKLTIEDFNVYTRPAPPPSPPPIQIQSLSDLQIKEKQFIVYTLKECHFNQTEAANKLGISRDALIRKMKKYAITVSKTD